MKRREVGYVWRLRQVMANRGLFSTTDLHPLLAERGIELSATQVYRLVTQPPERLNMRVLAAVCDALACSPNDLIEPTVVEPSQRQAGAGQRMATGEPAPPIRPTRVQVVPPRR